MSAIERMLEGWDEDDETQPEREEEVSASVVEQPGEEQPEEVVEQEQPEQDEQDDEQPEEEETHEDEDETVEEEEEESTDELVQALAEYGDDPEVRAFLAKYQGNPAQAFKAAFNLQRVLGRQGQEKAVLARKVQELEQQLANQSAFQPEHAFLTAEQQQWVGDALASGNQQGAVRQAVEAGEYGLARAVCQEWAREDPFQAMRLSSAIDQAEYSAYQQPDDGDVGPVDHMLLMDEMRRQVPGLAENETAMVEILNNLDPWNPVVQDAKSADLDTSIRGIMSLLEIARGRSATVSSTREQLRTKQKTDAANAKRRAVVSSSQATPAVSETPRRETEIMSGLTWEQLDAEWEKE